MRISVGVLSRAGAKPREQMSNDEKLADQDRGIECTLQIVAVTPAYAFFLPIGYLMQGK